MAFANKYLTKKVVKSYSIIENPDKDLKIIIVIPCFNEDKIIDTILSIINNNFSDNLYEIIIVINHAVNDNKVVKGNNVKTLKQLRTFVKENKLNNIFCIKAFDLPVKKSGVGFARKIGMDLAVSRFNLLEKPNGIIVSLDADTLVANNYLTEIEKIFDNKNTEGISIYFEHEIDEKNIKNEQSQAIILYELYLRYFLLAMKFAGYKNVFHTVGSAFAVTAQTYVKYGGMVTKKAGEDFYFINKISSNGKFKYLKTTTVYPSSRASDRVPFGTGPEVAKIINDKKFLTYDFNSFLDIKPFIDNFYKFYNISDIEYSKICRTLSVNLVEFLDNNNFFDNIVKISANCTNINIFEKAFFKWFSVFRVIKFLNFSHTVKYQKQDVVLQVKTYLKQINRYNKQINNFKLLKLIRDIDISC